MNKQSRIQPIQAVRSSFPTRRVVRLGSGMKRRVLARAVYRLRIALACGIKVGLVRNSFLQTSVHRKSKVPLETLDLAMSLAWPAPK